mmetsp:Transcript_24811/g.71710  ORF Transcript_24811/g.71710 Transcript_24811/m.71710 type:complete len:117 (-) Transcript_24811:3280-3630(-)
MGLPCQSILRATGLANFTDNLFEPTNQDFPKEFAATPIGCIPAAFADDNSCLETVKEATKFGRGLPISLAQYILGDEIKFENVVPVKRIPRRNDHLPCVLGQRELTGSKKRLTRLQ